MTEEIKRLQFQTVDIERRLDDAVKRTFEIICKNCLKKIIVKISISSYEMQEEGGTVETFYCICGQYHRLVKRSNGVAIC